jgi:hypothetical protein
MLGASTRIAPNFSYIRESRFEVSTVGTQPLRTLTIEYRIERRILIYDGFDGKNCRLEEPARTAAYATYTVLIFMNS